MHWPRFAVLALVAAVLQAGWIDSIALTRLDAAPDLLLILMVFFSVRCDPKEAIVTSFTLGFAADIVTIGSAMGPRMLGFGLFGTALSYMHRVIAIRKIPHEALAILVAGFGTAGLAVPLAVLAGRPAAVGGIKQLAATSIYSAIAGPFLFMLLDKLMQIKTRRRSRK